MQPIKSSIFGFSPDGLQVNLFELENLRGIKMSVINYGCAITSLCVPDRHGHFADVVLGYDALEDYILGNHYVGCITGRFAGRIGGAAFSQDGKKYPLSGNDGIHHLHGGYQGLHRVVWDAEPWTDSDGAGIVFRHISPDGHEGYPGNVHFEVRYFLAHDNRLSFEYRATTDLATIINLTQHSYFNLSGKQKSVFDHELYICADDYLLLDPNNIPTGELAPVRHSPFDFSTPRKIRQNFSGDPSMASGSGYDHMWVLRDATLKNTPAARLYDGESGRGIHLFTSEPGLQIYTANGFNAVKGKNNVIYEPGAGICLETQHFPDAPNHPHFPTTLVLPEEPYFSKTTLAFFAE